MKTRKGNQGTPTGYRLVRLQWGRVREDAERFGKLIPGGNNWKLQWGRVREDAERALVNSASVLRKGLQWGRVREDAESI